MQQRGAGAVGAAGALATAWLTFVTEIHHARASQIWFALKKGSGPRALPFFRANQMSDRTSVRKNRKFASAAFPLSAKQV